MRARQGEARDVNWQAWPTEIKMTAPAARTSMSFPVVGITSAGSGEAASPNAPPPPAGEGVPRESREKMQYLACVPFNNADSCEKSDIEEPRGLLQMTC